MESYVRCSGNDCGVLLDVHEGYEVAKDIWKCHACYNKVLLYTDMPALEYMSTGKVRDMYAIPGHDDKLLMVATDRISAFDVVVGAIPGKGRILTNVSLFWFEFLSGVIDNHLITANVNEYPKVCHQYRDQLEGRSMLVKKAEVFPVECIVRGYISGSFWKAYRKDVTEYGASICGFDFPPGMLESQKFAEPIFTPSTKAEQGDHDENISIKKMEELIGREQTGVISNIVVDVYNRAAIHARAKGIIIADTKFELGVYKGKIILVDEVLTPDSSRFWPTENYQVGRGQPSFDKQFLRDYLQGLVDTGEWNGKIPVPALAQRVIDETRRRYKQAETAICPPF